MRGFGFDGPCPKRAETRRSTNAVSLSNAAAEAAPTAWFANAVYAIPLPRPR